MVNHEGMKKKPVNQGSSKVAPPQAQMSRPKGTAFQSGSKGKVDPMHSKPQKVGSQGGIRVTK